MMMDENQALVDRLRRAAAAIADWGPRRAPRYDDWAILMDEAADALEAADEEDSDEGLIPKGL
jgi:hypothetical protein